MVDSVTVKDADLTSVTAQYASFFDLFESKWSTAEELAIILNNKLDVKATATSPGSLMLTQSVVGTAGNETITKSTTLITASGFSGGSNSSVTATKTFNIDGMTNRPEAWALVFKDHPSLAGGPDGAAGFIGADYGSNYPNSVKAKATRFRDEHAKRPVNIRNIIYNTSSVKVGNYRKGYEIVMLQKSDQKRWHREAYDERLVLPASTRDALPNTTNYLTLVGQAPFVSGNIFGAHDNNRQPDKTLLVASTAIVGVTASSMAFTVLGKDFVSDGHRFSVDTTGSGQAIYEIDIGAPLSVGAGDISIQTG